MIWTIDELEKVVLFSVESTSNLFGPHYVGRPKGMGYQLRTAKHGRGSVIVRRRFIAYETDPIYNTQGVINSKRYLKILSNVMLPHVGKPFLLRGLSNRHRPKFASKADKEWFDENGIHHMLWPLRLTDVKPTGHLCEHLARSTTGLPARNKAEVFEDLR